MKKHSLLRENSPQMLLFELTPQRTLRFLLLVISILAIASLSVQFGIYYLPDYPLKNILSGLFFFDNEANVPTMYSVLTLLFCAIFLGCIASVKKINKEPHINHWIALSIIFLFLSVDEFVSLHEKLNEALQTGLNLRGFLYYAWVIPGAAFAFAFLLIFTRFLIHLPRQTRRLFLLAGGFYISGALGVEMIGGYYASLTGSKNSMIYAIIVTVEESLEMLGIAVFIYSLLHYVSYSMKGTCLHIDIVKYRNKRLSA